MDNNDIKAQILLIQSKMDDNKADLLEIRADSKQFIDTLAKQAQTLAVISEVLKQQHISLETHIKRTNLLEERVEQLKEELDRQLKPVNEHISFIKKIPVAITWVVGTCGALYTVLKLVL